MRFLLILMFFLAFSPAVFAAEDEGRKVLYWYDPMVPGPKFDKPGKSPFMDMDLVPFYEDEGQKKGDDAPPENALYIEPTYRQALGVRTDKVQNRVFGKNIHAFGHIEPSTRLEQSIDVRTAGWIVDLAVDAVGDTVKKGDLLFTYYSPDLMQAQSDYLIGKGIGNAKQRLRLFGMDDKAIAALEKAGRFLDQTPFYAPADGIVTRLDARRGSYVSEGGTVFKLQDYSQVWVLAHLPLRDMSFIAAETPAKITINETGEIYPAAVDIVYPMTDPQSRNGLVRLLLDNTDGKLKTDGLVDVTFSADSSERLAVPEEAVLYSGQGAYVIKALQDGYFQPVMVKTGITADHMTEIVEGLEENDMIVTSGQFMIDAESNLRGGLDSMKSEKDPEEHSEESKEMEGMDHGHKH